MDLVGEDLVSAKKLYAKLAADIARGRKSGKAYWERISSMQALANWGLPQASAYMRDIDLSRAPDNLGNESSAYKLLAGLKATSTKGSRRQLHADPDSPHKSYSGIGSPPRKP